MLRRLLYIAKQTVGFHKQMRVTFRLQLDFLGAMKKKPFAVVNTGFVYYLGG